MTDDDSDVRALFEALKDDDRCSVQPFDACWEAARRRAKPSDHWTLNVSAIAASLVLLLLAAITVHLRSSQHASIEWISQWRSPTESLLKTPGSELFTTMPRVGNSIVPSLKEQH